MKKIYKGIIYYYNSEYFEEGFIFEKHTFINHGFWVAGNKKVNSYVLCDENGKELEKYRHIQFSKNKNNVFYVESV